MEKNMDDIITRLQREAKHEPHEPIWRDAILEIERLRADAARLDWLADPNNVIGNVQLPTHCVTANLHSMRDAIDMAMREQEHDDA